MVCPLHRYLFDPRTGHAEGGLRPGQALSRRHTRGRRRGFRLRAGAECHGGQERDTFLAASAPVIAAPLTQMNTLSTGRAAARLSFLLFALTAAAQAGADEPASAGNPWDAIDQDVADAGGEGQGRCCAASRRVDEAHLVHPITARTSTRTPSSTTCGEHIYHSFPGISSSTGRRRGSTTCRDASPSRTTAAHQPPRDADIHIPGGEDHGSTDLGLGFKYTILKDWETHQHAPRRELRVRDQRRGQLLRRRRSAALHDLRAASRRSSPSTASLRFARDERTRAVTATTSACTSTRTTRCIRSSARSSS